MCGPCRGALVCRLTCSCREDAGLVSFDKREDEHGFCEPEHTSQITTPRMKPRELTFKPHIAELPSHSTANPEGIAPLSPALDRRGRAGGRRSYAGKSREKVINPESGCINPPYILLPSAVTWRDAVLRDANRTSGGAGGCRAAIPNTRPERRAMDFTPPAAAFKRVGLKLFGFFCLKGFLVVSVTANFQWRGLHPPASQPADWSATGASALTCGAVPPKSSLSREGTSGRSRC